MSKPLLSAKLRDDGMVETEHADGWDVFDPAGVLVVTRCVFEDAGEAPSKSPESGGHYL